MISDPQFWNRFSVAVHQDDLEKQLMTAQSPKHSYVISSSSFSPVHSPLESPTSQTYHPLSSPGYPPMVQLSSIRSSIISAPLSPLSLEVPFSEDTEAEEQQQTTTTTTGWKKDRKYGRRSHLQKTPSTKPLLRPIISGSDIQQKQQLQPPSTSSSSASAPAPAHQIDPPPRAHLDSSSSSFPASPSRNLFRAPNLSTISLSLSGRPTSRFKFVTTITADASHRDSWLVRQKKKERQRTYLCWVFWLAFLALIAGVVTTILVLKARGII